MSHDTRLMVEAALGTRDLPAIVDTDSLVGLQVNARMDRQDGETRMVTVSSLDGTISGELRGE